MKTASRSPGSRPARARRVSSSRSEKPASTRRRVVVIPLVASTTVALPLLPLPRLQKRIMAAAVQRRRAVARPAGPSLAQVFEEQVDDSRAGFAGFRLALRIEDGHRRRRTLAVDLHPVLGQ